ncbi:hypothetical protein Shyhy01_44870 [Streptomyces hygroscopicus subsp. hygroscopicus]|nr:hypothetical protein Shyhy01_44870 [Streptomyces hygroscopicus subsp. hygroscopicus]
MSERARCATRAEMCEAVAEASDAARAAHASRADFSAGRARPLSAGRGGTGGAARRAPTLR